MNWSEKRGGLMGLVFFVRGHAVDLSVCCLPFLPQH